MVHEGLHAVAYEAEHLLRRPFGPAALAQCCVGELHEIGQRVEQRAVEIEDERVQAGLFACLFAHGCVQIVHIVTSASIRSNAPKYEKSKPKLGWEVHGAGDGTRTREYKLGKLGPYHLATPA